MNNITHIFIGDIDIPILIFKYIKNKVKFIASFDYNYENDWNKLIRGKILFSLHNDNRILSYFDKFIILESQEEFTCIWKFFQSLNNEVL